MHYRVPARIPPLDRNNILVVEVLQLHRKADPLTTTHPVYVAFNKDVLLGSYGALKMHPNVQLDYWSHPISIAVSSLCSTEGCSFSDLCDHSIWM